MEMGRRHSAHSAGSVPVSSLRSRIRLSRLVWLLQIRGGSGPRRQLASRLLRVRRGGQGHSSAHAQQHSQAVSAQRRTHNTARHPQSRYSQLPQHWEAARRLPGIRERAAHAKVRQPEHTQRGEAAGPLGRQLWATRRCTRRRMRCCGWGRCWRRRWRCLVLLAWQHKHEPFQGAEAAAPGCRQRQRNACLEVERAQLRQHQRAGAPAGRQRQRLLLLRQLYVELRQQRQRARMDVRQAAREGWEVEGQPAQGWGRRARLVTCSTAGRLHLHETRLEPSSHLLRLGKAPGRPHASGMPPGRGPDSRGVPPSDRCSSHCMVGTRWGEGGHGQRLGSLPHLLASTRTHKSMPRLSPAHLQLRQLWEQQPGIGRARRLGRAGCAAAGAGCVHPHDLRHPARSAAGHLVPLAAGGREGATRQDARSKCSANAIRCCRWPDASGVQGKRPCRQPQGATHQWWVGSPGLQPAHSRSCEMPRAAVTSRRRCMTAASSAVALLP